MTRRTVTVFAAAALAAMLAAAAFATDNHRQPRRVHGVGQVRFCIGGVCGGPELWAHWNSVHVNELRVERARRRRLEDKVEQLGRKLRAARAEQARRLQAHEQTVGWPWIAIADCESGDHDGRPPYTADWDYNGSSGFDGGVQFHPGTWSAYRHADEPAYAYEASPLVQVAVAERVLASQGWRAWPVCSHIVGLR